MYRHTETHCSTLFRDRRFPSARKQSPTRREVLSVTAFILFRMSVLLLCTKHPCVCLDATALVSPYRCLTCSGSGKRGYRAHDRRPGHCICIRCGLNTLFRWHREARTPQESTELSPEHWTIVGRSDFPNSRAVTAFAFGSSSK